MAKVFLTYRLKPGVDRENFETWSRTVDYPGMRGLARVRSFVNHRALHRMFSEERPSCDYIEVVDIPDLEGFIADDLPGALIQALMGELNGFIENAEFIVTEEVV